MNPIIFTTTFLCLTLRSPWTSAAGPPDDQQTRYPTFGVAFRQPKGWAEQLRTKPKTIAWWISPDSTREKPLATIMVECGHPPDPSLDKVAEGLAKNFRGIVDDHPTTLGGTRALRVFAQNRDRTVQPVEGLATIHDGLVYLVMGGEAAGHSAKDEIEAIRASWKWVPIEPPYKHLEFLPKPLFLSAGAVTINVPALMDISLNEHMDRVLDLSLYNVVRNKPDFLAYAQVVAMRERLSFDEYRSRLSDGLCARYKIQEPIAWRMQGNDPSRFVSSTIEVQEPDDVLGRTRSQLRWSLVKLDEHRLVAINFTLPHDAPGGPNAYSALMVRIVDSIQPGAGERPEHVNR